MRGLTTKGALQERHLPLVPVSDELFKPTESRSQIGIPCFAGNDRLLLSYEDEG
jgi:hypothetical protein